MARTAWKSPHGIQLKKIAPLIIFLIIISGCYPYRRHPHRRPPHHHGGGCQIAQFFSGGVVSNFFAFESLGCANSLQLVSKGNDDDQYVPIESVNIDAFR